MAEQPSTESEQQVEQEEVEMQPETEAAAEELAEGMSGLGVEEGPTGNEGIQGFGAAAPLSLQQPFVIYFWGEGEPGLWQDLQRAQTDFERVMGVQVPELPQQLQHGQGGGFTFCFETRGLSEELRAALLQTEGCISVPIDSEGGEIRARFSYL